MHSKLLVNYVVNFKLTQTFLTILKLLKETKKKTIIKEISVKFKMIRSSEEDDFFDSEISELLRL